jgi:formylglycine-generating enzyme required for sulfatase activity
MQSPASAVARNSALQRELQQAGMVLIPGGEISMGASIDDVAGLSANAGDVNAKGTQAEAAKALTWLSTHASPRHQVRLAAFAMAKRNVTRSEYARFVQETGHVGKGCVEPDWKDNPSADWRSPGFPQTDNDPVVCVSYEDADAYIQWWSKKQGHQYRLPTEAEWEHAARAGTTTSYWWGADESEPCRFVNAADRTFADSKRFPNDAANQSCADGYTFTSPVESFRPNGWGLYDMSGNAWQLTADCWNANYDGAPTDGSPWKSGDCSKHVVRGGSWNSFPANLRVANRNRTLAPRECRVTFRLTRTLP